MTYLSAHFTLSELTATDTDEDNTPSPIELKRLTATARHMEAVRALLKKPIIVNSGYRSPAVNKAVGGSPTSAHALGYAVDFTCAEFGDPMAICRAIRASDIAFDQLILERNLWVHISFDPRVRHQILSFVRGKYIAGLRKR
jgi:putative chitinase